MQIITLEDKHSAAGLCPRLTAMLPQAGNRAQAVAIPGNLPDSALLLSQRHPGCHPECASRTAWRQLRPVGAFPCFSHRRVAQKSCSQFTATSASSRWFTVSNARLTSDVVILECSSGRIKRGGILTSRKIWSKPAKYSCEATPEQTPNVIHCRLKSGGSGMKLNHSESIASGAVISAWQALPG